LALLNIFCVVSQILSLMGHRIMLYLTGIGCVAPSSPSVHRAKLYTVSTRREHVGALSHAFVCGPISGCHHHLVSSKVLIWISQSSNSPAIKRHPILNSACSRRLLRKKLLYIVRHPPTMVPSNVPLTPMTAVRTGTSIISPYSISTRGSPGVDRRGRYLVLPARVVRGWEA
jgi:hypothetical protein